MSEVVSLYPWLLPAEVHAIRTMAVILADVARHYGLTIEELKSPSRAYRISHPRQEAMWLMRQQLRPDGSSRYSYPQIGRFLGGRDHCTVIRGIRSLLARQAAETQARAA